jgi:peptide chain release factor subunit 1
VALLTPDAVSRLVGFGGGPVTSCYLDVDGRRLPAHADIERSFERLLRSASEVPPRDRQRLSQEVRGFARSNGTRALAMFSAAAQGLWEVLELPASVRSRVVVQPGAYVRPLEAMLSGADRTGVLLVDRQVARVLVYQLGSVVERAGADQPLARQGADDRGELYKTRVAQQREAQAHAHLRQAAQLAFEVHQRAPFKWFFTAGPADVLSELDRCLHAYLRERLGEHLHVAAGAPEDEVRRAVQTAQERAERRADADLVARVKAAKTGGRAVLGLRPTIEALAERRVGHLLVSSSLEAEGWRCTACGRVALLGPRCPACGVAMTRVPDVFEAALEEALAQHAKVDVLVGDADLDVAGGAAALLRY